MTAGVFGLENKCREVWSLGAGSRMNCSLIVMSKTSLCEFHMLGLSAEVILSHSSTGLCAESLLSNQ